MLDLFLPLWLAALIVTVVLFAVAGILALLGKKQVTRAVAAGAAGSHRQRQGGRRRGQARGEGQGPGMSEKNGSSER